MANSLIARSFKALLGIMAGMAGGGAVAATFTYTDNACTSFAMDNNVITCVTSAAPSTPPTAVPACAPTPTSPASTAFGSALQFSANCSNSPTSYVWKLDGNAVATAATYSTPTSLVVGPHIVSVLATNAIGNSNEATISLGVNPPAAVTQVPACTLSPTSATQPPGTGQLFAETCSNSPSSYVWKVDGAVVPGATSATYTTATSLAAGVHSVAVTATNTIGTSVETSASLIVQTVTSCPQSNTIVPLNFETATGLNYNMVVNNGQAISFSVVTSGAGAVGNFLTEMNTLGQNADKFMNVSTSACDFDYRGLDTNTYCADSGGQFTKVMYEVTNAATSAIPFNCALRPNTTYYVNIRNEKALGEPRNPARRGVDSCAANTACAFVFQMQKH